MESKQPIHRGQLVGIEEATAYVPLKRFTLYAYVAARKIPFLKIGSRVLFDIDELTKWADEHRVDPLNGGR